MRGKVTKNINLLIPEQFVKLWPENGGNINVAKRTKRMQKRIWNKMTHIEKRKCSINL